MPESVMRRAVRGLIRGSPVLLAAWALACSGRTEGPIVLPSSVGEWTAAGTDAVYGPGDLHDYIDGAAEVYRAFGVREVLVRTYTREGAPPITADVFDMGTSEAAFGAFHHDVRQGEPANFGHESERSGASVAFWRGRYYVSILAEEETDISREGVLEIGRALAAAIHDEGAPPKLLRLLPANGWQVKSVRFVPNKALLDRYYFLADTDLLDLDGPARAILASVRRPAADPGDAFRVLIVGYPDREGVERAASRFREAYLHDAGTSGIARTENGRYAGIATLGAHALAIVLDATSSEEAEAALADMGRERKRGIG